MAAPALVLVLLAGASAATPASPVPPASLARAGEVLLDVSGTVSAAEEQGLDVHVTVTNRGTASASGVSVAGELAGAHDEGRLEGEIEAGRGRTVDLHFPSIPDRPGVHPVALRLDFAPAGAPAAARSQCAYLLVTVGANPPPTVRLTLAPLALGDRDPLRVVLESTDGAAHRARVRALVPRGLTTDPPTVDVDVPARGSAIAELPILRGGAPRPSRQGVVVLAETDDGPLHSTAVTTGALDVRRDPARLPALRAPLAVLALLLAFAAAYIEWRRRAPV